MAPFFSFLILFFFFPFSLSKVKQQRLAEELQSLLVARLQPYLEEAGRRVGAQGAVVSTPSILPPRVTPCNPEAFIALYNTISAAGSWAWSRIAMVIASPKIIIPVRKGAEDVVSLLNRARLRLSTFQRNPINS